MLFLRMNFSSEIIFNICKFLQIEDIIDFQLTNKKIYNSNVYRTFIWDTHNKTDLNNYQFKKNTKKMYYSFKNNLCHLCDKNIDHKNKLLKILCFNCTSVFSLNSELIIIHKECFLKNNGKLSKFANVFNCRCVYCDSLVMAWLN